MIRIARGVERPKVRIRRHHRDVRRIIEQRPFPGYRGCRPNVLDDRLLLGRFQGRDAHYVQTAGTMIEPQPVLPCSANPVPGLVKRLFLIGHVSVLDRDVVGPAVDVPRDGIVAALVFLGEFQRAADHGQLPARQDFRNEAMSVGGLVLRTPDRFRQPTRGQFPIARTASRALPKHTSSLFASGSRRCHTRCTRCLPPAHVSQFAPNACSTARTACSASAGLSRKEKLRGGSWLGILVKPSCCATRPPSRSTVAATRHDPVQTGLLELAQAQVGAGRPHWQS